jgi:tetratricopeptide (TPR) repeat protein
MKQIYYPFFLILMVFGCNTKSHKDREIQIQDLIKLASVSDSLKDYPASIKIYREILEIDSNRLIGLNNLGRALVWNGQTDSGFDYFDKAVTRYPCDRTYYTRAMAYGWIKNNDKSRADLRQSITLNPNFGEGYSGLSILKEKENDLDSAMYFCDMAEKHACPPILTHGSRYSIFAKEKKYESAAEDEHNE